jgi:hypothetical protein
MVRFLPHGKVEGAGIKKRDSGKRNPTFPALPLACMPRQRKVNTAGEVLYVEEI